MQKFKLILNSLKCAKENVPEKKARLKTKQILSIQGIFTFSFVFYL